MKKNIQEKCQELESTQNVCKQQYNDIFFYDTKTLRTLLEKVREICKIKSFQHSMAKDIAKMSIKDMQKELYPCSNIKWSIEDGNIHAHIEAIYRGYIEDDLYILFPYKPELYEQFIEQMKSKICLKQGPI